MMALILQDELFSATKTADILGITSARVGVLCRQGRFDGAAKIGRNWIIPRKSVEEFTRLKPGVKPRTATRSEDAELIARTLAELKGANDE